MALNGVAPAGIDDLPCAVDTTGADLGIAVQVEGAVMACREFGCRSVLVGPEQDLKAMVDSLGASDLPISIEHAPETITMDESPVRAVRRKPQSSLCVAYGLLQRGLVSSVISAGNSGAMMAAGRMIVGLLPGIERPAIAALIPGIGNGRPNCILDSGANVDCHTQNLVQFAVMGAVYYHCLFDVEQPSVALLSNGTEASKGNDITRGAAALLSSMENMNYIGYVEGRDVPLNTANVIVCDGFVGNVLLKGMEGCARLVFEELIRESQKSLLSRLGLLLCRPVLKRLFLERFDYTAHGGAPLLGLKRLAIVLHGSSDARAVKNAIRVSRAFAKMKMVDQISSALAQLEDTLPTLDGEVIGSVYNKPSSFRISGFMNREGSRGAAGEDRGDRGGEDDK